MGLGDMKIDDSKDGQTVKSIFERVKKGNLPYINELEGLVEFPQIQPQKLFSQESATLEATDNKPSQNFLEMK